MARARSVNATSPTALIPSSTEASPSAAFRLATVLLLGAGVCILIAWTQVQDIRAAPALAATWGPGRWTIALLIALFAGMLALFPRSARRMLAVRDRLANPSRTARRQTALAVGLVSLAYLILTAHLQDRDLFPKSHDEQSYWLQAHMLAVGRLWMPTHPLADFFDTFFVISHPVTASQYFIGTAMLNVPAVWFGLPAWIIPSFVAAMIVALIYRIVAKLIDGVAGLVAVIVVLSLSWFRIYSMLVMGHEPLLLFGLLMTWAWLRWNEAVRSKDQADTNASLPAANHPWIWPLFIGFFAGWAGVTRPVDALCFAGPIGVAMLITIARAHASRRMRLVITTTALVIAGAAPFLTLQAICNQGVTGSYFDTPFSLYAKQDMPGVGYFSAAPPGAEPRSVIRQKRDYYEQSVKTYLARHADAGALAKAWWTIYLPLAADAALPCRPAVVLMLAGILGIIKGISDEATKRRSDEGRGKGASSPPSVALSLRRSVAHSRFTTTLVLPLLLIALVPYTFFLEHYAIVLIPAALVLVLLGIRVVAVAAGPRFRPAVSAGLTAGLLTLCLISLPEFNPVFGEPIQTDETFTGYLMRPVREEMPQALQQPAIVLFKYTPGDPIYEEPVYNTAAAWPDDCPVICAHDLGPRNMELIRYFAAVQPDRHVYLWNRKTSETKELGTVKDLAAKGAMP